MHKSIYHYLMAILLLNVVMSDDFCTDVTEIDSVFFISDLIYLLKNPLLYTFKSNTSLTDTQSDGSDMIKYLKTALKVEFQSIVTGFHISKIPDCSSTTTYCVNMNKSLNMGFLIGNRIPYREQSYVTFKLNPYLVLVTDVNEMPFNLKPDAEIASSSLPNFWPLKPEAGKILYRHSAYVESRFELIHMIFEFSKGTAKEYCHWTTLEQPNGNLKWNRAEPSLSGNPITIDIKFFGMLQTYGVMYAIVKLENYKQSLLSYTGKATFLEEKAIDIRKDIYGCNDTFTSVTTIISISTSISVSETTKATSSPQINASFTTTIGSTTKIAESEITTEERTKPSDEESKSSSSSIIIVVMIVMIFIVLVVGLILAIVFVRPKGTSEETAKKSSNKSQKESLNEPIKEPSNEPIKEPSNEPVK